jgi:ArsR family transcriptional regulator
MYRLPWSAPAFDLVTIHHVLHFAEEPARAVAEAARLVRPGGHLLAVDFAPHQVERLRSEFSHRRLGFADREVREWLAAADLRPSRVIHLPGNPLTVAIWRGVRPQEAVERNVRAARPMPRLDAGEAAHERL